MSGDIIKELPLFEVDGNIWEFYSRLEGAGGPVYAEHNYFRANGTHHEHTRQNPRRLSLTLLFYNNATKPDAFPRWFVFWRQLLESPGPKDIVDPTFGPYRAVVKGDVAVNIDAQWTGGGEISCQFSSDIEDPDQPIITSSINLIDLDTASTAEAVDAALADANVELPKTAESPQSVAALMAGVETSKHGGGQSLSTAVARATGVLTNLMGQVDALNSNQYWSLQNDLAGLLSTTLAIGQGGGQTRPTRSVQTQTPTTLKAFAGERGNDHNDIMLLNPHALTVPVVPAGTRLTYYV